MTSDTDASRGQPHVVLLGGIYHPDAEQLLRRHARVTALNDPSPSQVRGAISQAHGAIVRYPIRIDEAVLQHAPVLGIVASSGRGTDSIDVAACTAHGVAVVNNPGLGTRPVSEHALAMMLALARRLVESSQAVREPDAWPRRTSFDVLDLHGRTLGIVGLGLIGTEMARKCMAAFDMRVLGYDPYVPQARALPGVTMVSGLDELLGAADVVTLHCELNDETRGMIGDRELRLMKRGAFLVNTSRGKVVRQDSLVRALSEGWIAGAALDVYEDEPLPPDSPVFRAPHLMMTPHIAGLSGDALHQLAHSAVNQLLQAFDGKRPANLVNPPAWKTACERLQAARR